MANVSRWPLAVLIALLILPAQAFDAPAVLDVQGEADAHSATRMSAWPHADSWYPIDNTWIGISRDGTSCDIHTISVRTIGTLASCDASTHIVAADHAVYACEATESGIRIHTVDLTGAGEVRTIPIASLGGIESAGGRWVCHSGHVHEGVLTVTANYYVASGGRAVDHAIVRFDMVVDVASVHRMPSMEHAPALGDVTVSLLGVSANADYVALSFVTQCQPDETNRVCRAGSGAFQYGLAWFTILDQQLRFMGARVASPLDAQSVVGPEHSLRLSGPQQPLLVGHDIVAQLGRHVVGIDARQSGVSFAVEQPEAMEDPRASAPMLSPLPFGDATVIPRLRDIIAVDSAGALIWQWDGVGRDAYIVDVKQSLDGQWHVLLTQGDPFTESTINAGHYVRLTSDGRRIQEVPIDLGSTVFQQSHGVPGSHPQYSGPTLLPVAEGAVLVSPTGNGLLLAESEQVPFTIATNNYPQIGEVVQIEVRSTSNTPIEGFAYFSNHEEAVAFTGTRATIPHLFNAHGEESVTIVVKYVDNPRSFSSKATFFVGSPIPDSERGLNWMQEQFTPEKQETTWGLIGILIVVLGAITATLSRFWGRRRIHDGLVELTNIQNRYQNHPRDMIYPLRKWRRRQEERMLSGRLTEDQFRILEAKGQHALEWAISKMLSPVSSHLSPGLWRQLRWSLRDGHVNEDEWKSIMNQCHNEEAESQLQQIRNAFLIDPNTGFAYE